MRYLVLFIDWKSLHNTFDIFDILPDPQCQFPTRKIGIKTKGVEEGKEFPLAWNGGHLIKLAFPPFSPYISRFPLAPG